MLRAFRSLLVLLALCCGAVRRARAAEPVDLLLVFAADVSRSIDQPKFQLQREGYAAAIADKRVLEAITAGRNRRIAVALRRMVGRQLPEGPDRLDRDRRRRRRPQVRRPARSNCRARSPSAPRSRRHRFRHGRAGERALSRRRAAPSTCRATAPTIPAATSRSPATRRVAQGVTINGLVILSERPMAWNPEHTNPPGGLANYYRNNVDRRPRRLRDRGRGFQFVRPGHHQEADRRDRRTAAGTGTQPTRGG